MAIQQGWNQQTSAAQNIMRSVGRVVKRAVKRRVKKTVHKVAKRASSKVKQAAKFVKGSAAAKAHMAKLRKMRKK